MKRAIAGFAAGLVVAAAAYRLGATRQDAAVEAARDRASVAERSEAAARVERERSVAELEGLRGEVRDLKARLEAPPSPAAPPPQAGPAPAPRPRPDLRALAADLARLRPKFRGSGWDDWPPEAREQRERIEEALLALAAELEISPDEASRTPDGLALLALELLRQSTPPLDPAQETRLRALLDATRPDWERWRSERASKTALEARRGFLDVAGRTRSEFLAALSPEQRALVQDFGLLERQIQGSQVWFDGPREAVTRSMAARWATALDLDERQAAAVDPIVRDYIRQAAVLNDSIWARRRAGEELSREADYALRLDLMIATQKRIAEAAGLNPAQVQALKEWQFTYGANVTDGSE